MITLKLKFVAVSIFSACISVSATRDLFGQNVEPRGDPLPESAMVRLGCARLRHGSSMSGSALSPDGKILATAGDHAVIIWDTTTYQPVHKFACAQTSPFMNPGLAFSSDGSRLAYVRNNHFAWVWDLKSGKETHRFERFDKDKDGEPFGGPCRFVNDDKDLLVCTHESVETLRLETGKIVASVRAPFAEALSPDGRYFVRKEAKRLIVGEVVTGNALFRLDAPAHHFGFGDWVFAPDSKTFVAFRETQEIELRKLPDGGLVRTMKLPDSAAHTVLTNVSAWRGRLAFSADGATLHVETNRRVIHRFDVASGKSLAPLSEHISGVVEMHVVSDGRTFLSTGTDGVIRRWDLRTCEQMPNPDTYEGGIDAAYSGDGKWAVVGDSRGRLDLWDVHTGKLIRTLQLIGKRIAHLAFTPDHKTVAAAEHSGTVRFWRIPSGEPAKVWRQTPEGGKQICNEFQFSHDGQMLWMHTAQDGLCVYEVATEKLLWRAPRAWRASFSPRDDTLAISEPPGPVGSFVDTKTWKVRSKFRMNTPTDDQSANSVNLVFAPNGRRFAATFDLGCLAICDANNGEEIRRLATASWSDESSRRSQGGVWANQPQSLAFSADGHWLASAGTDTHITIWEVATGKEVHRLSGHDAEVANVAFGPDGKTLTSFAADGQGYLWTLSPKMAGPQTFDELWDALDKPGPAAYRAQWQLIADAKEAARNLKNRLKPIPVADAAKIQQWIADLDSDKFPVREAATRELLKVGEQVRTPIDTALAGDVPLETRRRLKQVVDTVMGAPGPETLRTIRAIMVLERIGTPESRTVLTALAGGAPGATPTDEAAAALKRLR